MSTTALIDPPAEPVVESGAPPSGPSPRLRGPAMADLALVAGVVGLLGALPLPPAVSAALLGAFVLTGPGAAFCTWVRVPRRVRAAAVPVLGMATMTLVTITAMWSYRWDPTAIAVWCSTAVLVSSLLHYRRRDALPAITGWPRQIADWLVRALRAPGLNAATGLLGAALIVWALALPSLPGAERASTVCCSPAAAGC